MQTTTTSTTRQQRAAPGAGNSGKRDRENNRIPNKETFIVTTHNANKLSSSFSQLFSTAQDAPTGKAA